MAQRYRSSGPNAAAGVEDLIRRAPDFGHYAKSKRWVKKAAQRTEALFAFTDVQSPDFIVHAPKPQPV